jgi:proteasome lid subunit RPN8/RPN11
VAGFYHTHPAGEGLLPSVADRAGHPPGSLVLLVGDGCWRAYRIRYGQWNLLPLRLR